MKSVVARLPEELYESVRRIAGLRGRQPSEVLSEAWTYYMDAHREQFAADFEQAAQYVRAGDTEALAELANRGTSERAAAAAEAARH
jgi:hypothetical protein